MRSRSTASCSFARPGTELGSCTCAGGGGEHTTKRVDEADAYAAVKTIVDCGGVPAALSMPVRGEEYVFSVWDQDRGRLVSTIEPSDRDPTDGYEDGLQPGDVVWTDA